MSDEPVDDARARSSPSGALVGVPCCAHARVRVLGAVCPGRRPCPCDLLASDKVDGPGAGSGAALFVVLRELRAER